MSVDKTELTEYDYSKRSERRQEVTMVADMRLSQECLAYMISNGGWKTVWKRLDFAEGNEAVGIKASLRSPYRREFSWEPGWLEAKGEQYEHGEHMVTWEGQVIAGAAIHTYFNKPDEAWSCGNGSWYMTLVPLRVHVDDFIAAGYESIYGHVVTTFRRVYLTHADCEMAVKDCLVRKESKEEAQEDFTKHVQTLLGNKPGHLQQLLTGAAAVAQFSPIDSPTPSIPRMYEDAFRRLAVQPRSVQITAQVSRHVNDRSWLSRMMEVFRRGR